MSNSTTGLDDNVGNLICYALGWITGVIMLLVEKKSAAVRFHAAQSIVIFGVLTIANLLLPIIPGLGPLIAKVLHAVSLALWLGLCVMSLIGNAPRIPVASEYADQLLAKSSS